jgi:hypothetical protein
MPPIDVFISYSREDKERVLPLVAVLEDRQLTVWFDADLEVGETFDEQIHAQLTAARAVMVCWSPQSVGSRWVRSEAQFGAERKKLVSVFIAPCTLLPPFNLDHTEDLSDWDGPNHAVAIGNILRRIDKLTGKGRRRAGSYRPQRYVSPDMTEPKRRKSGEAQSRSTKARRKPQPRRSPGPEVTSLRAQNSGSAAANESPVRLTNVPQSQRVTPPSPPPMRRTEKSLASRLMISWEWFFSVI